MATFCLKKQWKNKISGTGTYMLNRFTDWNRLNFDPVWFRNTIPRTLYKGRKDCMTNGTLLDNLCSSTCKTKGNT